MDIKSILPVGFSWREFWEAENINGLRWPSSLISGNAFTLSRAAKKTTCDGVHFTGAATSNMVVTNNAIQNSKAAFNITFRFKLNTTFATGAANDYYLFQKTDGVNDYLRIYLENADGRLHIDQHFGGATVFQLASLITNSWTAGVWYTVTLSFTDTPTQRLLVNGVLEDSSAVAANPTPTAGDMVIGSSSDGGVDGIIGTISWIVIGVGATAVVALTAAEETDLNNGLPPPTAKVQYMYMMTEGRGVTVVNAGSSAGNGT